MAIEKLTVDDEKIQKKTKNKGLNTHNQWLGEDGVVLTEDAEQLLLFEKEAWGIWGEFDKILRHGLTNAIEMRSQAISPEVMRLHEIDDLINIMPPHIATATNHIIAGKSIDELATLFHKLAQEAYVSKIIARRALFIATRTAIIAKSLKDAPTIAAMVRGINMSEKKHAKDPKKAAKSEIKALWLEWQVKPHLYKSKAEFAREMQKLHKDDESEALIKDTKTITDTWIKEWQSEQNTTPVYTA